MGFWDTLGGIGEDVGKSLLERNKGLAGDVYGRYKRRQNQPNGVAPAPPLPGDPASLSDTPAPDNLASPPNQAMPDQPDNSIQESAALSPWRQPQSHSGASVAGALLPMIGAEQGTVVTEPTIAKVGENGPEMVVPLNPRAGNHLQPDILQGRYKSTARQSAS